MSDGRRGIARSTLCVARCLFAIYRDKKVKGAAAAAPPSSATLERTNATTLKLNTLLRPAEGKEIIRLSRSVAKCEIDSGFPPRNFLLIVQVSCLLAVSGD